MLGSNSITNHNLIVGKENVNRRYKNTRSTWRRDYGFDTFVTSILPPPPDKRNVVLKDQQCNMDNHDTGPQNRFLHAQKEEEEQQAVVGHGTAVVRKNCCISSANTTLIGDYIASVFSGLDAKWLVQAQGNAMFMSVLQQIQQGLITVDPTYVFFQLRGNQLLSANKDVLFNQLLNLVVVVKEKHNESRIYFIAVFPKPIDNDNMKPLICKMNRWLAIAVDRIAKMFNKVRYLLVQHDFLDGNNPKKILFNDDGITLNAAGAQAFRTAVFRLAD